MKHLLDLTLGPWSLVYAQPGERPDWRTAIPATVPGGVLLDLYRAQLIPDPFYAENFRGCRWTEEWTFWYRTEFSLPIDSAADRSMLRFEGIDTYAEVFVDGKSLGETHNMFCRHEFSLSGLIGARHELVVRIDPWLPATQARLKQQGISLDGRTAIFGVVERLGARKMQQAFGWDNTPRLLAGGIFRPVGVRTEAGPILEEPVWHVSAIDAAARTATVEWSGMTIGQPAPSWIRLNARHAEGHSFTGEAAVDAAGAWQMTIGITEARLWWPNGAGLPDLYTVRLELCDSSGRIHDTLVQEIGLRRVVVATSPAERRRVYHRIGGEVQQDADGGAIGPWTKVELKDPVEVEVRPLAWNVNGNPLFIKGANWQPTCAIPGGETTGQIETLLSSAQDANLNLIRVWGGGLVEPESFYRGCTRRGLLVWQDFFFACGQFPYESAAFCEEIRLEAENIVRRLRNHTCLAAWCGDNESDMMNHDRGIDPASNVINRQVIPQALQRLDPQHRYYHPSSPSGGDHPRSDWGGDKRNWGAWQPGGNYAHIRQEDARFISEAGSYALPARSTIQSFMPERLQWPLDTRTWRLHTGDLDASTRAFWKLNFQCWDHFGPLENLDQAIALSQFAQAWGYRLLIERCRQRRGECGGIVLWKLNDTWPCSDAGLLDYELVPRLALTAVRQAYAPVAVSLVQATDSPVHQVLVWLCNDRASAAAGRLRVEFDQVTSSIREPAWQTIHEANAVVLGGTSQVIHSAPMGTINPQSAIFRATWIAEDPVDHSQAYYTLCPRTAWLALATMPPSMSSMTIGPRT